MKVRIIVECDGKDVGRFLGVMPQKATFTVTRLNEEPKVGSIGKMMMLMNESPKRQTPKRRTTKHPSGLRMKDVILGELKDGPKPTAELTRVLIDRGFNKDSVSGRLWELIHRDKSIHREGGLYHLTLEH